MIEGLISSLDGTNQISTFMSWKEETCLSSFRLFPTLLAKQESKVSLPEFKKGKDLLCLADEKVLPNILWQVPLLQKEQVISRGIFWVLPWTCMPVVKHEHRLL